MRSAGFEPATPSLGSSYPNQAKLTSPTSITFGKTINIFFELIRRKGRKKRVKEMGQVV